MNASSRLLYGVSVRRDRLLQKYRQAWNGLSVLIFTVDSARPPRAFRVNYLILFFFALICLVPPAAALWIQILRNLDRTRQGNVIEGRTALLREVVLANREKLLWFEKLESQGESYRDLADRFQEPPVAGGGRAGNAPAMRQGSYNTMSMEWHRMRSLRERLLNTLALNDQAFNFLGHRLAVWYSTPRGMPLHDKDLLYIGKYGSRIDPTGGEGYEFHEGADLICASGRDILAAAAGEVIEVVDESDTGYGHFVRVHHGLGFITLYAHTSENLVKKGDQVKRGQVIAKVGATGRAIGAHLHYEVKLGPDFQLRPPWRKRHAENPMDYLQLTRREPLPEVSQKEFEEQPPEPREKSGVEESSEDGSGEPDQPEEAGTPQEQVPEATGEGEPP